MLGVDGDVAAGDRLVVAGLVLVDVEGHHDLAVRGDLGLHLEGQVGLLEADGGHRGGAGLGLVGDFGALLDDGFGLVGGHHAGAGHHLATAIGFEGRHFEVDVARGGAVPEGEGQRADLLGVDVGGRQIDAEGVVEGRHRGDLARLVGGGVQVAGAEGVAIHRHATGGGAEQATGLATEAEPHAQVAGEGVGGLDDLGFDQHLAHLDVDLGDEAADVFEAGRHVIDEELVAPLVGAHVAALGEDGLLLALDELGDALGLVVVDLEGLGAQRLELADLGLGFEVELLAGGQLVARGDPDDVAVLAHVEAAGLQDDVESLIPGDILEAQGEVALHRVAGDDVEIGEVGDHLQHRPDIDVLEVERQLLAAEAALAHALGELVGVFLDGLHLENKLVVALVGVVLPLAARRDGHAHVAALALGEHGGNRGAEIDHIELAAELFGRLGLEEVDDQAGALLADVDAGAGIGQIDDQPALAFLAAAEVDVTDRVPFSLGHGRRRSELGGLGDHVAGLAHLGCRQGDQDVAVFEADVVGRQAGKVEHQPGAVAHLDDVHAAQVAGIELLAIAPQAVAGVGEVEGDPRRAGHAEASGCCRERLGHRQLEDDVAALLGRDDLLDAVAGLHDLGSGSLRQNRRGGQQGPTDCRQYPCALQDATSHFHFFAS